MHKRPLLMACLVASGLAGCGSETDNVSFNGTLPTPSPVTSPTPVVNTRTITVPPGGGTVELPATAQIFGTATFAPGAAAGTQLTITVSETAPAGASIPVATGLSKTGFYYISLSTNQPFDLGLLTSLILTDKADNVTAVPQDAEQYRFSLTELSSGNQFLQEIPGQFQAGTASFSQARGTTLQPGRSYLLAATATQHPTLKTTFVNNSGINPAYVTITGQNPDPPPGGDPNFYHVTAQGQFVPMQRADREPGTIGNLTPDGSAQFGYCDYTLAIPANATLVVDLPLMKAGRAYTSLGDKLLIRTEDPIPLPSPSPGNIPIVPLNPLVRVSQPNGWGLIGDRNYKVLWDWVEYDYTITPDSGKAGIGINKTEVDMFGFGMQINLTGPTVGNATVGTNPDGRKKVFDALAADDQFKSLLIPGPGTGAAANVTYLRAIAPAQGVYNKTNNIPGGTFNTTFYDQYISDVFTRYASTALSMFTSAFGTYTARTVGDKLVWSQTGFPDIVMNRPTTADAFEPTQLQISGAYYQPTPGASPVVVPPPPLVVPSPGSPGAQFTPFAWSEIASALSAGFNRSTLLRENFITRDYVNHPATLTNFYQPTDSDGKAQVVNQYARHIHLNALPTKAAPGTPPSGGAAYAFGFDDNSNQSSFIAENNVPTSLTITITKLDN